MPYPSGYTADLVIAGPPYATATCSGSRHLPLTLAVFVVDHHELLVLLVRPPDMVEPNRIKTI